jgi:NLR family CARD domain-containing protein 3
MSLDEFQEIFKQADLMTESIVEKDLKSAFCISMMTQVDELNSDRIFQMSVLEFMEALARVADKLSLPDYYSKNEMTMSER